MDEATLRKHYGVLYRFIAGERLMRLQVFKPGHPNRERKVRECDVAMDALNTLKEFAKAHVVIQQGIPFNTDEER